MLEFIILGVLFVRNINKEYISESSSNDIVTPVIYNDEEVVSTDSMVRVDVKGAVKNPGVYEVSNDSRINDAILLAGGLKSNASTKYLNLSMKVSDEMVINVYTNTQLKNMEVKEEIKETCSCETIYINECAGSNVVQNNSDKTNSDSVQKDSNLISINSASKDELMTLSGIGDAKADAIIEYRNKNGSFNDISEIKNVSGISDNLYEKIKGFITV